MKKIIVILFVSFLIMFPIVALDVGVSFETASGIGGANSSYSDATALSVYTDFFKGSSIGGIRLGSAFIPVSNYNNIENNGEKSYILFPFIGIEGGYDFSIGNTIFSIPIIIESRFTFPSKDSDEVEGSWGILPKTMFNVRFYSLLATIGLSFEPLIINYNGTIDFMVDTVALNWFAGIKYTF